MITRTINGLKKLWRGEQPLGRAFWVYFVIGQIGFMFLSFFVAVGFLALGLRPLGVLAVTLAVVVYPVFAAIGVWRSANAYELNDLYPFLAKAAICLVLAPMAWSFINGEIMNLVLMFMG